MFSIKDFGILIILYNPTKEDIKKEEISPITKTTEVTTAEQSKVKPDVGSQRYKENEQANVRLNFVNSVLPEVTLKETKRGQTVRANWIDNNEETMYDDVDKISKIIELGAGLGRDTIFFAKNSIHVTAVDYSSSGLKVINDKAQKQSLSNLISTKIFDVRFNLLKKEIGYENYLKSHIKNAYYVNLESHLSSEQTEHSGRHPLPDIEDFSAFLNKHGIVKNVYWQSNYTPNTHPKKKIILEKVVAG